MDTVCGSPPHASSLSSRQPSTPAADRDLTGGRIVRCGGDRGCPWSWAGLWLGRLHPAETHAPAFDISWLRMASHQPGAALWATATTGLSCPSRTMIIKPWPSRIKARRPEEQTLASEASRQPRQTAACGVDGGGGTAHGQAGTCCGADGAGGTAHGQAGTCCGTDGPAGQHTAKPEPAAARTGTATAAGTGPAARPAKQPGRPGRARKAERTRPAGRQAPGRQAPRGRAGRPPGARPAGAAPGQDRIRGHAHRPPGPRPGLPRRAQHHPLERRHPPRRRTPLPHRNPRHPPRPRRPRRGLQRARLRHARPLVHRPSPETLEPRRHHQPPGTAPVLLRAPQLLHSSAGLDRHRWPNGTLHFTHPQGWLTLDSPLPGATKPHPP